MLKLYIKKYSYWFYQVTVHVTFDSVNNLLFIFSDSSPIASISSSLSINIGTISSALIFVSGDNVYLAGYEENSSNKYIAKWWKNGVEQAVLPDGFFDADGISIFIAVN